MQIARVLRRFWDNRVTQHAVSGDFGDQPRVIQRITLRGDVPA